MKCSVCAQSLTSQEVVSYIDRCEDCCATNWAKAGIKRAVKPFQDTLLSLSVVSFERFLAADCGD